MPGPQGAGARSGRETGFEKSLSPPKIHKRDTDLPQCFSSGDSGRHVSGSPAVCAQVSTGPKMRGARLDHAADDTPAAPQRRQGRRYDGTCSAGQRPVPDVIRRAIERDGSSVLQRQPMGGLKTDQQHDGTFPRKRRPPARSNARKQHPARQASSRRSARPPPQRPGERVDPWGKVCALLAAIAPPPSSRDPGRDQAPAVTVKHGPGRSCCLGIIGRRACAPGARPRLASGQRPTPSSRRFRAAPAPRCSGRRRPT